MADLSNLTDEQLKALYGAQPAPSGAAGMTDDELRQAYAAAQPAPKTSYGEDVKALVADPLGVIGRDVAAIPGDIASGITGLVRRGVHDVQHPADAGKDALAILRALSPFGAADAFRAGMTDPETTLRQFADPARPVTSLLNDASLLTGGELTAGRGALKAATTAAKAADKVGQLPVSLLSGMSPDVQNLAFQAGEKGGEVGSAFRHHMRGGAAPEEVVDTARAALKARQAAQNADYLAGRTLWGDPNILLDAGPVRQALADARTKFSFGGVADNGSIVNALNEAEKIIDRRLSRPVPANVPVAAAAAPGLVAGRAEPALFGDTRLGLNPAETAKDKMNLVTKLPLSESVTPGSNVGIAANQNSPVQSLTALFRRADQRPHGPVMRGSPTVGGLPEGPMPSPHNTPIGFDKLKQELDTLMYDRNLAPEGTKARAAVGEVANAVRQQLRENVPGYAEEMELASHGIRKTKEIRKALSLGERSSTDTAMAKLQSTLRNDVLSRYGFRKKSLLDKLTKYAPELPYELAGQSASNWLPRGITGRVAEAGNLIGHGALHGLGGLLTPSFLIPLLASSPRVVGETRYAAGSVLRGARKLGATQKNLGRAAEAARLRSLFYPDDEDQ